MLAKYNMSVEQNIFVAKRNIVDYIWKSANFEGIAVTYPETDNLYNGINVARLDIDDITTVNNLKHAWKFVLENIEHPINFPFICKINQYVGSNLIYNAGFLRNVPATVGGTNWKPTLPIESQIRENIEDILSIPSPTDRAVTLMLYGMRKQMFIDGNKRTAMLAGNHIMISNGVGIISVPIEKQETFKHMIIEFYESDNMEPVKKFVYDNCIDGMDFRAI
ncbi:MAG: Fic family protein [Oscillospiraceae bacterium]|nr:Fic family protein [Oscillospiraceae bacterium]